MLLNTLSAGLLVNISSSKGTIRADECTIRKVEGAIAPCEGQATIRVGQDF